MPLNKGGKKKKRFKKHTDNGDKELLLKEDGQEYAQVTDVLGNCRFRLLCSDGKERLGILRGKMRKRQWVRRGDFVIVGIREFNDSTKDSEKDKCDIFHVYHSSQASKIRKMFTSTDEKTDSYIKHQKDIGFIIGTESEGDPMDNDEILKKNQGPNTDSDSDSDVIDIDDI